MWELRQRAQNDVIDGRAFQITQRIFVNDNEVQMIDLGTTREHVRHFRYIDKNIEFDFRATRWDADGVKLLKNYRVELSVDLKRDKNEHNVLRPDYIDYIKSNIESLLRFLPVSKQEMETPIVNFVFI